MKEDTKSDIKFFAGLVGLILGGWLCVFAFFGLIKIALVMAQ